MNAGGPGNRLPVASDSTCLAQKHNTLFGMAPQHVSVQTIRRGRGPKIVSFAVTFGPWRIPRKKRKEVGSGMSIDLFTVTSVSLPFVSGCKPRCGCVTGRNFSKTPLWQRGVGSASPFGKGGLIRSPLCKGGLGGIFLAKFLGSVCKPLRGCMTGRNFSLTPLCKGGLGGIFLAKLLGEWR